MTAMIVDELARIPMSPHLAATLTRAADYAFAQQHPEVTLEHLLLALAEDQKTSIVLNHEPGRSRPPRSRRFGLT